MTEAGELATIGHARFRKALLRVVFWALGLAALFGATGVIFTGHDTLWRIVGTCAATAAGALVVLGASRFLDLEATWPQGVALIGVTVFEYVVTLGLTWKLFGDAAEPMGQTMLFLAITALPAVGLSTGLHRPETVASARVGIIAAVAVLGLLLVGAWGQYLTSMRDDRWADVAGWLALFAGLAITCLVGAGDDGRHWRWLGVAAATVAFVVAARATISCLPLESALFTYVVTAAAVVAHANVVVRVPLRAGQRWLLWGTVAAGIATGFFIDLARLTRPWQADLLGRLAGAAAIVGGCGTLALLVLARINQRSLIDGGIDALQEVALVCPRCRKKQTVAVGSASCRSCGLVIEVRLQEPPA